MSSCEPVRHKSCALGPGSKLNNSFALGERFYSISSEMTSSSSNSQLSPRIIAKRHEYANPVKLSTIQFGYKPSCRESCFSFAFFLRVLFLTYRQNENETEVVDHGRLLDVGCRRSRRLRYMSCSLRRMLSGLQHAGRRLPTHLGRMFPCLSPSLFNEMACKFYQRRALSDGSTTLENRFCARCRLKLKSIPIPSYLAPHHNAHNYAMQNDDMMIHTAICTSR